MIAPPVSPIAPGSSIFVPVSLKPAGLGPRSASLLIESSDIQNPGLNVPLIARGTNTDVSGIDRVPKGIRLHEGYPQPIDTRVVPEGNWEFELSEAATCDHGH